MKTHRWRRWAVVGLTGLVLWAAMLWILPQARVVQAAGPYFVKPTGSGTACTQAAPCTLGAALIKAVNGDSIYLGAGTYTGVGAAAAFSITRSIALYGGWNGAATGAVVRDARAYTTTLSGQLAQRVVFIGPAVTVTLEGLGIMHGKAIGEAGGLYASGVNLTLREVRLTENYAGGAERCRGGAVSLLGGNLVVEGCWFERNGSWGSTFSVGGAVAVSQTLDISITGSTFRENDAWQGSGLDVSGAGQEQTTLLVRGNTFISNGLGLSRLGSGGYAGALQVHGATVRIEGNTFRGNRGSNRSGVMEIDHCDLTLNDNWLLGNQAWDASALFVYQLTNCQVVNNVIAGGTCSDTGCSAIRVAADACQFAHNTIAGNKGASAILTYGRALTLTNTILVSHTLGISVGGWSRVNMEGTLWGAGAWATGTWWGGQGVVNGGTINIVGLPEFVNPAAGDYHLLPGSAAIDAGVFSGVAVDIDGQARPVGSGYDIGADEYVPPGVRYRAYVPAVVRRR